MPGKEGGREYAEKRSQNASALYQKHFHSTTSLQLQLFCFTHTNNFLTSSFSCLIFCIFCYVIHLFSSFFLCNFKKQTQKSYHKSNRFSSISFLLINFYAAGSNKYFLILLLKKYISGKLPQNLISNIFYNFHQFINSFLGQFRTSLVYYHTIHTTTFYFCSDFFHARFFHSNPIQLLFC